MRLSDEHVTAFQALYKRHFGRDISKEQAREKGIRLLRLMETVLKHEAKKNIKINYDETKTDSV